jgi:hypothetical protein
MLPHRVQHHDDALITEIINCTDSILRQDAGCAVQDVIVLDSSNAVKYSAHLIMHLEQRHALTSIHDAGVLAKKVTVQLAPDLCQVHGAEKMQTVVDTSVYKRHQQCRIMGCVKHGDTRVLRLHPRTTKCDAQLVDTLICVPAEHMSMPPQQQADPVLRCRPAGVRCSTEWLPNLLPALSSKLTCGFYDIQLHARYGFDSPSVYLHTIRTTCAVRQHQSNHAVVEVRCDLLRWRLLCRDGCKPGPWSTLSADALQTAATCPAWLVQQILLWAKKL